MLPLLLDRPLIMAQMCNTSTSQTRTVADVCSASQRWQPAAVAVPRVRAGHAACCKRMPRTPAALSSRISSPHDAVETLDLPPPPPPLKPVPIIHTTAYLQQTQQLVVSPDAGSSTFFGSINNSRRSARKCPGVACLWACSLHLCCQVTPPAPPPPL